MRSTWLVAHDFSPAADAAMMVAASDLERLGGHMLLMHAYRLPPVAGGLEALGNAAALASWNKMSNKLAVEAEERLDDIAEKLRRRFHGLVVTTRVVEGAPVPSLLRVARESHVARLVLGYSPRTGIRRRFAGSTSEEILKEAEVPVLIVRGPSA